MPHPLSFAVVALLFGSAASAAEVKAPRDTSSGMSSGKVSLQDLHFSTRADAQAKCPDSTVVDQADGSFACSAPPAEPAGMAINEKGLPGTKTPAKPSPK